MSFRGEAGYRPLGMDVVSEPRQLPVVWSHQYARLAEEFASLLPPGEGVVVEVGSGRGQLTIPLAGLASRYRFIAVDRYEGPYVRDQRAMVRALSRRHLGDRVRLVTADCLDWLETRKSRNYLAVISSELFPELDSHLVASVVSSSDLRLTGSSGLSRGSGPRWPSR